VDIGIAVAVIELAVEGGKDHQDHRRTPARGPIVDDLQNPTRPLPALTLAEGVVEGGEGPALPGVLQAFPEDAVERAVAVQLPADRVLGRSS
jgi:hypothetical protein